MTVARAIGPARVQCIRCGKRVTPFPRSGRPRAHTCPHGWTCTPTNRRIVGATLEQLRNWTSSSNACPVCAEAKRMNLWTRHDGKPHDSTE